jgi:hypothetical protein
VGPGGGGQDAPDVWGESVRWKMWVNVALACFGNDRFLQLSHESSLVALFCGTLCGTHRARAQRQHRQNDVCRRLFSVLKMGALTSRPETELPMHVARASDDYATARLRARVAVLEQDMEILHRERSRIDGLATEAAATFQISPRSRELRVPSNGSATFHIVAPKPGAGFCDAPGGSASTFLVTWTNTHTAENRQGGAIFAACPTAKHSQMLSVQLPALQGPREIGVQRYLLCVKMEIFNLAAYQIHSSNRSEACHRLSLWSGRDVGCINATISRAKNAPAPLPLAPCGYQGFTPGGWLVPSYEEYIPVGCAPPNIQVSTIADSDRSRSVHSKWDWLRVLGDSITGSTWRMLRQAPIQDYQTNSIRTKLGDRDYKCACGRPLNGTRFRCVTLESYFDHWNMEDLAIPTNAPNQTLECILPLLVAQHGLTPEQVTRHFNRGRASHVLVGLGAHNSVASSDVASRERYFKGFARWLSAQRQGVRVIFSLEPARDPSVVPVKFQSNGAYCKSTNMRVKERNQAAMDAFRTACELSDVKPSCRVLDLFSPSLPLLFDTRFYDPGDPIHIMRRCRQSCYFVKDLLQRVLLSFTRDN